MSASRVFRRHSTKIIAVIFMCTLLFYIVQFVLSPSLNYWNRKNIDDITSILTKVKEVKESEISKTKSGISDEKESKILQQKESKIFESHSTTPKKPSRQYGPGELGQGVTFDVNKLSEDDRKIYNEGFEKHHVNILASDLISLHRSLDPTLVHPKCKEIQYPNLQPSTVVIAFRNEAWSLLIRTLHSVLDRTPHELLKEIILVDDYSTDDDMKLKLDYYLSFLPKVRFVRLPERGGMFVATQTGIDLVTTSTFVVLDSHCEVYEGWLEPLIQRLQENPKLLVIPMIGNILWESLYYFSPTPESFYKYAQRAMTFDFFYTNHGLLSKKSIGEHLNQPNHSGHHGNVFAVDKEFFAKLGGFDRGLNVWGGMQMETMFKYVMCGGDMEIIPCSHVGHVYRSSLIWNKELDPGSISNQYRIAEVWMDEYKHLVFKRKGNYTYKFGDVTERKKIREKNNCKSFQYFLDHIREIIHFYIPENLKASGALIRPGNYLCLHVWTGKALHLAICEWKGKWQFWEWSQDDEVRCGESCMDVEIKVPVHKACSFKRIVRWKYNKDNTLQHHDSGLCLTAVDYFNLTMAECKGDNSQIWHWNRT